MEYVGASAGVTDKRKANAGVFPPLCGRFSVSPSFCGACLVFSRQRLSSQSILFLVDSRVEFFVHPRHTWPLSTVRHGVRKTTRSCACTEVRTRYLIVRKFRNTTGATLDDRRYIEGARLVSNCPKSVGPQENTTNRKKRSHLEIQAVRKNDLFSEALGLHFFVMILSEQFLRPESFRHDDSETIKYER